jgi:hypothetical protein
MTAAYRLKGLGWFGSCAAIVLGFYLVSLQVATERKKLDTVNQRIVSAQRDLRALETEFDTRANMVQLERWNGDTLALSAPTAGQFVRDEAQLASLDVNALGDGVEAASLVVPSVPVPGPVIPSAAPAMPPTVQVAAAIPASGPATVIKASAHLASPVPAASSPAAKARLASAVRAKEAVAKVRPQAVAMLDNKLLSDRTLGDLLSGARNEAGHRR